MKLSDYLKRFTQDQRADFALRVGTTLGHLNNVSYGLRTASAALTRSLAAVTEGAVREWELRTDDWHLIWPELIGSEGAPPVPQLEPAMQPDSSAPSGPASPDPMQVDPVQRPDREALERFFAELRQGRPYERLRICRRPCPHAEPESGACPAADRP